MGFLGSIEFYIILAVLAAAIVAFASRPQAKRPAQEYLLAGDMLLGVPNVAPSIALQVMDNNKVHLVRTGLDCLSADGAISLAIKVIGQDVWIEERLTPGRGQIEPAQGEFILNFLRPGRYHVKYNSQKTGLFAVFPLHVSPGIKCQHLLKR